MSSTPTPGLDRPANLRDVAGLPTEDGGRTRAGVLLRSDAPMPGDVVDDLAWPPGAVVDLRTDAEIDWSHPLAEAGARLLHLPLTDSLAPDAQARGREGGLGMDELYDLILQAGDRWLPELFALAARGPSPLLVHCAAGKDRTGVAVAVLLRAVGVTRASVEEDFAATNDHRQGLRDRLVAQGALDPDVAAEQVGVRPVNLARVLDRLDDDPHGLLTAAGVPEADLDAWRERLVEPA